MKDYFDDKMLIIVSLTIIAIVSAIMFKQESIPIINNIVSGLLGAAIGNIRYNK